MAKITLDGIAREVVLERSNGSMTVTVDGRRHVISAVIALTDSFSFMIGNASHMVFVSSNVGGTQLSFEGRTYMRTDASADNDSQAPAASGSRDGRVQAPMPGGIIAVHVHEGDHVTTGQPLVVLESMKMHNEITSPADGVVRRIHSKVGDQVSFGHVLVEIGAE